MRRVLLLLPLLLTAVLAAPASAHTRLVSSTPAQGGSAEAPAEVVLVFSDPVQTRLSAVSVTGADGAEHVVGTPSAGGDGSSVAQALRAPLPLGSYRVAYRVLASDGHPVTGSFEITATAGAAPPSAAATTGAVAPAADEPEVDGGAPVLPLAVGGLVVAGAAGLLARRLGDPPPQA